MFELYAGEDSDGGFIAVHCLKCHNDIKIWLTDRAGSVALDVVTTQVIDHYIYRHSGNGRMAES